VRNRSHMGVGFEVWNSQRTWLWHVVNPHRNGGAIGAAASEAEAIREARSSIEEMTVRRRSGDATMPVNHDLRVDDGDGNRREHGIGRCATSRAIEEANPIKFTTSGWNELLANLDCYLTQGCGQFA
jgi:hypothetical protein